MKAKPSWIIIVLLAVIKFGLPFILQSPAYELQRDEYLYYQQGLHFDIGYLENPPLLSWFGMVSSWLGGSEFWIKFWPSLFGAFTVVITCLIAFELGGRLFAQFIAGLAILTGSYMRMFSLFQPNALDILLWTFSLYFLIRYIKNEDPRFLYGFVFGLAVGWWGKYSIAFLGAAIFISMLISPYRKIFLQRKLHVALLIGLLLILPNIIWQYFHKWPLIHHMQELQQTQLQFLNPADFIKDQLLYLLPAMLVWISGLTWLLRKRQWRFLAWTYFFVIVFLLLGRGKSYYSMGIYPMLLAAGGVAIEQWTARKEWLRFALTIIVVALGYIFIPLLLPISNPERLATFYKNHNIEKTGVLGWEDQKNHLLPQDFADMLGWKELAKKTEHFFNSLPNSEKADALIYCENYGQAGALKFYGIGRYFTGKIISANGSFALWLPSRPMFKHIIYVGEKTPAREEETFQHFQSGMVIDSVTNIYSRQLGNKIIYYKNIDPAGLKMVQDRIKQKKQQFSR